jgi:uncharacterized protein (DUF486 family)
MIYGNDNWMTVVYMKMPLKLDFLWAGLCLLAAAYFMFRGFTLPS